MEENQSMFELEIDQTASKNLIDAARWARFMAIFMFVTMGCVLIILIALQDRISTSISDYLPSIGRSEGFVYLLMFVIVIVLVVTVIMVFLLRGAVQIKRGIETRNQQELVDGLRSLKIYFTIYGVLAIVSLVFSIIGLFSK